MKDRVSNPYGPKFMASSGFGSNLINPPSMNKQGMAVVEEALDDRISKLPDPLLVQILSLLPMKDAFATCVLSKMWQYLWTSVYNINFTCRSYERITENFVSFVNYVLDHTVSSKIKKFMLDCTPPYLWNSLEARRHNLQISRWLSFAVEKNVEDVLLTSNGENGICTFPESFCNCSSLINLVFSTCCFGPEVVVAWKSLKSIHFECFGLLDEHIVNVLSGCPALETMELNHVGGFRRLDIRSSKLKRLKLEKYLFPYDGRDHSLEIIAPYLQQLEITGDFYDLKCRLVDVSSVVNAKLTFNIICIKDVFAMDVKEFDDAEDSCRDYHQVFRTLVQDYLQKLSCATELTVGTWLTGSLRFLHQVLCMLQFGRVLIPELKCKSLTLELHIEKFNLYGAAGLLRASTHVELLNIYISAIHPYHSRCRFELHDLAKGDDIDLQAWISSFAFPNLKKVKLVVSSGMCLKDYIKWIYFKKLFKLSKFLLMNASVLEKFVIKLRRRRCEICSMNCVSQYLFQLAENLLICPRSSTNCEMIFQE